MTTIKVKKLHSAAKLPSKAFQTDAGLDICCVSDPSFIESGGENIFIFESCTSHLFHTGISVEIEPGYCLALWDKSGLATKFGLTTLAGIVDSGYVGEVLVCLYNFNGKYDDPVIIREGQKIVQGLVLPVPLVDIIEVGELSDTDRGSGGFGSTGKF